MTSIPFNPVNTNNPPFQTDFTLDGQTYRGVATWNIAGQRWYLTIYSQSGDVVWCGALIGSPIGFDMPLAPGIFTTSQILYREDTGNFEVTP